MNLKNFKSGVYRQQYQYKSFMPTPVNHLWVWDDWTWGGRRRTGNASSRCFIVSRQ